MKQSGVKSMLLTACACAAMLAAFAALAWSASARKCATYDEPLHLVSAWLADHEDDFRCDPEDPPLWKMFAVAGTGWPRGEIDLQLPAARGMLNHPTQENAFTWEVFNIKTPDSDALLHSARARMLFVAVLLGVLLAWWGWQLGGGIAAMVATAMFCFDPNFMAHAPLMKNDVAISAAMLALCFALWRLGRTVSWVWFGAVAITLAIALNIKFSGVMLIPVMLVLLLCRAMLPTPWPVLGRQLMGRGRRIAAAGVIGMAVILMAWGGTWICYDARFLPTRDASLAFDLKPEMQLAAANQALSQQNATKTPSPETRQELAQSHSPGATVACIVWLDRHRMLPQSWLAGLLYTYANSQARPAFLMGQKSISGWWYYFPLAMVFKTPLATLAALAAALIVAMSRWREKKSDADAQARWPAIWSAACLIVPPAIYLLSAMHSHLNLGLRHVLPIYPFLFIGVGVAAAWAWKFRPRTTAIACAVLGMGLLAENICAFPDYIPFFNAIAGGQRGGLNLLSDSNLDWGQDLPLLAQWQRENPNIQLGLCYFGSADPRKYGIHYVNLRGSNAVADEATWRGGVAVLAISATDLQGTYLDDADRAFYEPLLHQEPIKVLGGSIYLFEKRVQ